MFIFNNKLGEQIRQKRKELGYTLRELEEKSGVSYSQLSKIERGDSIPSANSLRNIAYSLNIDKDILLGLGGYISEDVYAELISTSSIKFTDEEYFEKMTNTMKMVLLDYEDIEKLIKDIYGFLYHNKEYYVKNHINEKYIAYFEKNLETSFHEFEIEEMLLVLEIELVMIYNLNKTFEEFLKEENIHYSKNEISWNDFFAKESENKQQNNFDYLMNVNEDFIKLPIYGEIKAGYGMIGEENIIGYEMAAKSKVSDGDHFYLLVKGDSMIDDGIIDGCMVLVKRQNTVANGKVGVVIINGEEATLKRVIYDGNKIILMAANKNILPKTYDISEVLIQGQVKSFVVEL